MDNVERGFNATVLAYGQTGAGKTFTMTGASGRDSPCVSARDRRRYVPVCDGVLWSCVGHLTMLCAAQRGLIPRIFEELFRRLESRSQLVRMCLAVPGFKAMPVKLPFSLRMG